MLSDDYVPIDQEQTFQATVAPERTISCKNPDVSIDLGYLTFSPKPSISYLEIASPLGPTSPPSYTRGTATSVKATPKSETSGDTRRRSLKIIPLSANTSVKKSPGVSNNNNSKPMTARDRKRRQMHNASAMRSRIRLNETLDKMWKTIPAARRKKGLSLSLHCTAENDVHMDELEEEDDDDEERIGRADKVEVAIDYIMFLEERIHLLEGGFCDSR